MFDTNFSGLRKRAKYGKNVNIGNKFKCNYIVISMEIVAAYLHAVEVM